MATSKDDASRKVRVRPLVKLDKAFKLAEQWVNNMTKLEDDDDDNSTKSKLEARPPRLGVGAVVPRQSNFVDLNDPIERKLRFKLDKDKRNAAKKAEESGLYVKDGVSHQEGSDSEDDDDVSESKAQSFSKKRPPDFASSLKGNNKKSR